MAGILYIVSAASGTGKTSLIHAVRKQVSNVKMSVSYTTRKPRSGEQNGIDYHFISLEQFNEMVKAQAFLEHAEVFGHHYGTAKEDTQRELADDFDLFLEIDWQGAQIIRQAMTNIVSVFILPPSAEALRERILARDQDDIKTAKNRLKKASGEIEHYKEYDYLVVNDNFSHAVDELKAIVQAERCRRERQQQSLKTFLEKLISIK